MKKKKKYSNAIAKLKYFWYICNEHNPHLVQQVRTPDLYSGCRWFKSISEDNFRKDPITVI